MPAHPHGQRPGPVLLLAWALVPMLPACQTPAPTAAPDANTGATPQPRADHYPRLAPGIENPAIFPAAAAGFQKGSVIQYGPGLTDYSVGYDDPNPALPSVATLYFYRSPASLPELFAREKRSILAHHPGARELGESITAMPRSGRAYPAWSAAFTYEEAFGGRPMRLYSRLLVVALPKRFFNLRFSAPYGVAGPAEARRRQLLDAIDWAFDEPVAPGPSPGPLQST